MNNKYVIKLKSIDVKQRKIYIEFVYIERVFVFTTAVSTKSRHRVLCEKQKLQQRKIIKVNIMVAYLKFPSLFI